ncbi:MAG: hypothetical protein E7471_02295 [Ruminococcaceae bacterium]|nr:hypothetical protein [Oscillospiraceae bacterium]
MKNWIEKYDVPAKALAVLIAVVLWLYVVNFVNTDMDMSFRNLSPSFTGSEELLSTHNLAVSDLDEIEVDVVISGARRDLIGLGKDDIQVTVDISKITEPGEYRLPYTVKLNFDGGKVTRKSPNELTVKLDRVTTATVPVRIKLAGEVEKGFMTDEMIATPSSLTVVGLEDAVSKISYAQAKITKKTINASVDESVAYEFYDDKDNLIDDKNIRADYSSIRVSIPVLKLIELPLAIDFVEGGGALLKNVNYELEPESIRVAVDSTKAVDSQPVKIGVVDLSKLSDSGQVSFQITLPEGYKNVSGETSVVADIEISGLEKQRVTTNAIEIINIPSGYVIEPITNQLAVTLRGAESAIKKVTVDNVRAVVDLESTILTPGQHTMTAKIVVDGVDGVGAIGEYKVVVRVSK